MASSPDEKDVIFAVIGRQIYESDDGGVNWIATANPSFQGRIPFLRSNKRDGPAFDLWFGDVSLYRAGCVSATSANNTLPRCGTPITWVGPYTRDAHAHDDAGDLIFSPQGCPILFSSDGGIYINTRTSSPTCHDPLWDQPNSTPHALWIFDLGGARKSGLLNLYFVDQDTGTFYTQDANAPKPAWINAVCCDAFDVIPSATNVLYTSCCWSPPPSERLFLASSGFQNSRPIGGPVGDITGWKHAASVQQIGSGYAVLTTTGLFITQDISQATVAWNQVGAPGMPKDACGVQVASANTAAPIFFLQTASCDGTNPAKLFRHKGISDVGGWAQVKAPFPDGGFGLVSVDRQNADIILASYVRSNPSEIHMVRTVDGGQTWTVLDQLDTLITQSGDVRYRTLMGPTDFLPFSGYIQPTLVLIPPGEEQYALVGTADSGLFLSKDNGATWSQVVAAGGGTLRIPRPRAAYFDQKEQSLVIFVGSQGRGVWRLTATR